MAISFQAALRLYAKQRGSFILPKKGSAEYEAVKKIQESTEMGPEHEVKKRTSKKNADTSAPGKKGKKAEVGGEKDMVLKAGVKGNVDEPLPPKAVTKVIDDPKDEVKNAGPVVPDAVKVKENKCKGVTRSGRTKKEVAQDFIVNENTGPSQVVSAQLPDQKEQIAKELKVAKKTPKIVTVGQGEERTVEGLKTDDPAAVKGQAPFSIQSLRNRLLC